MQTVAKETSVAANTKDVLSHASTHLEGSHSWDDEKIPAIEPLVAEEWAHKVAYIAHPFF